MFKRIAGIFRKSYYQETLAERSRRMLPGAIYGSFASTIFVIVSTFINIIFFPDLHLGVDWRSGLTQWIEFGIALAFAGAIVGWFTEDYMGIVGGGVILTILLFIGNLVASLIGGGSTTLTVQSFFTTLPLIGVCVLLAWAIRVAINRHLHIKQQELVIVRRKLFSQLIAIVFLVGFIPGVFSRFGLSSEYAIRTLNETLQNATKDPSIDVRFPIAKVPALKDHFGMIYTLFVHPSTSETGAMDITIRFEDGYTVTCLVPTESGYATFLQVCNEGTRIISP